MIFHWFLPYPPCRLSVLLLSNVSEPHASGKGGGVWIWREVKCKIRLLLGIKTHGYSATPPTSWDQDALVEQEMHLKLIFITLSRDFNHVLKYYQGSPHNGIFSVDMIPSLPFPWDRIQDPLRSWSCNYSNPFLMSRNSPG